MNEAENAELYGKCNHPYGHGHDYILHVSVRGEADARTGRVVSPGKLDEFVHDEVLKALDHHDLNRDVPEFAGSLVPTTENLAVVVDERLRKAWPFREAQLDGVRLEETKRNTFELLRKSG